MMKNMFDNKRRFFYCDRDKSDKNKTIFEEFHDEKSLCFDNDRYHLFSDKLLSCILDYQIINNPDEKIKGKHLLLIHGGKFKKISIISSITNIKNFHIYCLNKPEYSYAGKFFDDMEFGTIDDNSDDSFYECLKVIQNYSKTNNIKFDGILTYEEECIIMTARLAKELNLIYLNYEVALKVKDKYMFKKSLKEHNLFNYDIALVNKEFINNLEVSKEVSIFDKLGIVNNKQYIIKDSLGSSKNFVKKFSTGDDLLNIVNIIKNRKDLMEKQFVIEEYFEGLEIDIDIIIQDHMIKFMALTDNFEPDDIYFIEKGGVTPSEYINETEFNHIKQHMQRIVDSMNIDNIVMCFEARCRPSSIYGKYEGEIPFFPIESNLRIGGAEIFSFMITSYRYNFLYNQIKIAFGIEIEEYNYEENKKNQVYCASTNFQADKSGILKYISFSNDFFSDDSLVDISLFKKVGDHIDLEEKKTNGYLGWMVSRSKISQNDAIEKLNNLIKKVYFDIQ
jgi:hypothetical protein